MAANRPKYLFRTLFNILNAQGVNRANIVVSIDGFYDESVAVAKLFALRNGSENDFDRIFTLRGKLLISFLLKFC